MIVVVGRATLLFPIFTTRTSSSTGREDINVQYMTDRLRVYRYLSFLVHLLSSPQRRADTVQRKRRNDERKVNEILFSDKIFFPLFFICSPLTFLSRICFFNNRLS